MLLFFYSIEQPDFATEEVRALELVFVICFMRVWCARTYGVRTQRVQRSFVWVGVGVFWGACIEALYCI